MYQLLSHYLSLITSHTTCMIVRKYCQKISLTFKIREAGGALRALENGMNKKNGVQEACMME